MGRIRMDDDDLVYEAAVQDPPKRKPTCPTGKHVFAKASDAGQAAATMRAYRRDPLIHHYRCDRCSGWHTGHPPGSKRVAQDMVAIAKAVEAETSIKLVLELIARGTRVNMVSQNTRKAVNRLINRKYAVAKSPGVYEITDAGRKFLKST